LDDIERSAGKIVSLLDDLEAEHDRSPSPPEG